jgi:predicted nucleic acid-binding protein
MILVFIDSNVLFSALIGPPQSAAVILIDLLADGAAAVLLTGECCLREVERSLSRKLPAALPLWEQFIKETRIRVVPCKRRSIAGINAKDSIIVAAAATAEADYFVTGDKRLIAEMRKCKVKLPFPRTPREMLEALSAL